MKKIYLLTIGLLAGSLSYAQQGKGPNIYLGGKPGTEGSDSQTCFKPADFKNKISVSPGVKSIYKIDLVQVSKRKLIVDTSFTSVEALQKFDLHKWLLAGESKAGTGKDSKPAASKNQQKPALAPGERLAVEVRYTENGKDASVIKSFFLCK